MTEKNILRYRGGKSNFGRLYRVELIKSGGVSTIKGPDELIKMPDGRKYLFIGINKK